jgi:hypothetical protein
VEESIIQTATNLLGASEQRWNVTAANDWRLTNQESYLTGRTLRWVMWWSDTPRWDHDHCAFCWVTFMREPWAGDPTIQLEGYVTEDNAQWICKDCFEDFRERFGWQVRTT